MTFETLACSTEFSETKVICYMKEILYQVIKLLSLHQEKEIQEEIKSGLMSAGMFASAWFLQKIYVLITFTKACDFLKDLKC